MNSTIRGKGLIKGCVGIKDMYKYYIENNTNPIDYKLFAKITKVCNKELVNQLVNESEIIELPYRLGKLMIIKYERSYNHSSSKWAMDFQKSREVGFKVFHDQKYIYKISWLKFKAIVKNKTGYKFKACRTTTRLVAPALRNKRDYYSINTISNGK